MGLFDAFRRSSRQREPEGEWWREAARLRSDMEELQRSTEALHESVLTNLRKLAKRAERAEKEDCGCQGKRTAADPGGAIPNIREARARYGTLGGF